MAENAEAVQVLKFIAGVVIGYWMGWIVATYAIKYHQVAVQLARWVKQVWGKPNG